MYDSIDEIIIQYQHALKGIRHLVREVEKRHDERNKIDLALLHSMERDLEWTVDYIETGSMPAYSVGKYRKVVPVDPQMALGLCSKALISKKASVNYIDKEQQSLLSCLTEKEKEAIVLVIIEGISYGEAASMMKVTKSSVQVYVNRGKKKLKAELLKRGYMEKTEF